MSAGQAALNRWTATDKCWNIKALHLFIYFFSARLRENGWTDLHEIFREGVE